MENNFRDENTDMLMRALMSAESVDECYDFFRDLCSDKEIKLMSMRFQVARLLKENSMYSDIVTKSDAGTSTILYVDKMLSSGTGALKRAIERIGGNGVEQ